MKYLIVIYALVLSHSILADFQNYAPLPVIAPLSIPEKVCPPPIIVPPVIADFDPFACAIRKQMREIQLKAAAESSANGCPVDTLILSLDEQMDRDLASVCGY